jgi:hypothetical protein
MRRRRPGEHTERFFYVYGEREARQIQREIKKWAKRTCGKVKVRLRGDLPFLEDREAELWLPLVAVCQVAAPERVEELQRVALRISRGKQSEEPADSGVLFLRDIQTVFDGSQEQRLPSARLVAELNQIEESPWASWSNGRGLDARGLARGLRAFKIEPHNLLVDGFVLRGYEREDFEDAWATYLPRDSSATALQAAPTQANHDIGEPLHECYVADEKAQKPRENERCSGVAAGGQEDGQPL